MKWFAMKAILYYDEIYPHESSGLQGIIQPRGFVDDDVAKMIMNHYIMRGDLLDGILIQKEAE